MAPPAPKHSHEEQQALILNAATKCIEMTSIMDFTMSALSKEAGMSMGSIYKHIQTKEDVMVALATEMQRDLYQTFRKIFDLPVIIPLRLIALQMTNEDNACCYKFGGQLESLVSNEAVLQRASSNWLERMMDADMALEILVHDELVNSIESGELDAKNQDIEALVEEIMIGVWSMHVGFIQVARQRHARHLVGKGVELPFPLDVDDTIVQAQKRLLNTYPWAEPVTDESIEQVCQLMVERGLR